MKQIVLSRGGVALVSDEDFKTLSKYKWYKEPNGYARGVVNGKKVFMHRFILNTPAGFLTDHKNRDRLDNTRENLRICTSKQNIANSVSRRGSTSKYKGVCWNSAKGVWQVDIGHKVIGWFDTQEAAAHAYDIQAKRLYGEFARLNFS